MLLDRNSFAAALANERGFVVISADTALIPLQRKDFPSGEFALVSREDRHLGRYYWSKGRRGYPRRRDKTGRGVQLHREILGCAYGDGLIIDHINRDVLDCRRPNMRFVTHAENMQNQRPRGRTSRHRGVSLRTKDGKWVVHHKLDGKQIYSGAFATEQEAAEVARAWRAEHMPFAHD